MNQSSFFKNVGAGLKPAPTKAHTITQLPDSVNAVPQSRRHLIQAAGLVGLMTLTSRVLGMIRDILSAARFGTSWQWDAFLYAFMLPNFFRRLVVEGALSSAFIPVYSEILHQRGKEQAFQFANVLGTFLSAGLAIFLAGVEILLVILLKFPLSPRLHLTAELLQILFPYLFFISLFALAMGVLNSHHHFFTPSLGPVILDLAWIAALVWLLPLAGKNPETQLMILAAVLVISAVIQFSVDIPPLVRLGFRFGWIWDGLDFYVRKTGKLLVPAMLGFGVFQINLLVDSTCGWLVGYGANSALWYGNRLMQFPLGIFAVAMGTALLPTLSHQTARKEDEAAKKTLLFALRGIFFIILPCTAGLIVLSTPIVRLLFQRGAFDAVSTARTSAVLVAYSFGLIGYSGQKVLASAFYANQDTQTPVKAGVAALVTNIILNLILMQFFKERGLAFATSVSGILQFVLLMIYYHRKIAAFPFREIGKSFARTLTASLLMAGVCIFSYNRLGNFFAGNKILFQLARVFGSILISVICYIGLCFLFRVQEIHDAYAFFTSRKNR